MKDFTLEDYWRALILYGQQVATYKIALGMSLVNFVNINKTIVTIDELAEEFFELYQKRLQNNMPQLNLPNRLTVMERVVKNYTSQKLDRTAAIEKIAKDAFHDVIPRFHTLNRESLPINFYEFNDGKLSLTDNAFKIFSDQKNKDLVTELNSRWDLLEAAFLINRENNELINDLRKFYLLKGYERTDVTKTRPVLNGYQKGICFYCGELMGDDAVHVDGLP